MGRQMPFSQKDPVLLFGDNHLAFQLQDKVLVQSDFNLQSEFGTKMPSQKHVHFLTEEFQQRPGFWAEIQIRYCERALKSSQRGETTAKIFSSARWFT